MNEGPPPLLSNYCWSETSRGTHFSRDTKGSVYFVDSRLEEDRGGGLGGGREVGVCEMGQGGGEGMMMSRAWR